MKRQLAAMNAFFRQGVQVFEYGTSIRKECRDAGMPEKEAMTIPGFVAAYIRPLFMLGRGPFRWTCLSGEASDLAKIDDLVLEMFPHDKTTVKWIQLARKHPAHRSSASPGVLSRLWRAQGPGAAHQPDDPLTASWPGRWAFHAITWIPARSSTQPSNPKI